MEINKNRLITEFVGLCKISSGSRNERLVADYLVPELEKLGFAVFEDDTGNKIGGNCGNIIARKKGNAPAPALMFSAHMDTVGPCDVVRPVFGKDGWIYSDGTTVLGGDDKGGIAAIMEALRYLCEHDIAHGDLEIIFSVCEEQGITGAKHVDLNQLAFEYGYVLDAGGTPAQIITCAPAQETFTVKVFGKAVHAGSCPEDGVSAIVAAANAISRMKLGRIDFETTANVGIITGGSATNIIPDYVEMQCEARSRNRGKLDDQLQHMFDLFGSEAASIGARLEIDSHREYENWSFRAEDGIMKLAAAAAANAGMEFTTRKGGGGSDANIYNAAGRHTLVLGMGMSRVHSVEERIYPEDMCKAAEYILAIIKTAAGGYHA